MISIPTPASRASVAAPACRAMAATIGFGFHGYIQRRFVHHDIDTFSQIKCGIAGAGIAENSERFTALEQLSNLRR